MIWDFTSYRDYLLDQLGAQGTRSGQRKKLAHSIGVHTTFVSQVLSGKAEFSLEQGEAINQFFGHTDDESDYFIQLISAERAGTVSLRQRLRRRVEALRKERLNISNRVRAKAAISEKDRERFYSSYLYGAVHVLTSVTRYQDAVALSAALQLPLPRVKELLEFLVKIGLIDERGGRVIPTSQHVHLGSNSDTVLKHHANWRLHAVNRLRMVEPEDLHYSACMSLSVEDAFKVKESLLENLKKNLKVVEASKEQAAYVYNIDFYPLVNE